jgi:hypothetical protein
MARRTKPTKEEKAENRRKGTIYRNRKYSHTKKAAQIHKLCGAQISIVYEYQGRISTFIAKTKSNFPPSEKDLVSENFPPDLPTQIDFLQANSWPMPERLCMDDFLDLDGLQNEDGEKMESGTMVPELERSSNTTELLSLCFEGINEAIAHNK